MENTIDTLFGNGLFSNIYFVDSNPGKIETVEVMKINSEITEVKTIQSFDLSKHNIEKNGLPSLKIRENVKQNLIVKLNFNSSLAEIKYFNVGFLKKFFYKKDPKKLLKTFNLKSDWIITSEDIASELSTLEEFVYLPGYSDVRLFGKIGETMVFEMKDIGNVIYIGNKDSITAVFNRNLLDDENGMVIEYLIHTNENMTKIIVHWMLNDEHMEMLWEMTEIHFQCFEKFYKDYGISYGSVLELNHKKMLDISDNCVDCDPDILCFIFESIIKDYKMMLNKENPYLDSDS